MASSTATIRVSRKTRDQLAKQARDRGVSVAALVGELASEREAEAIWRSEREASLRDAQNPDVQREEQDWETTLTDGID